MRTVHEEIGFENTDLSGTAALEPDCLGSTRR